MNMFKDVDLRCGDCLEVMKTIPDGCIDLTVTSPPYDNLRTYNGNVEQWNFEKFKKIAVELYRVTKAGGVVVWVVGDATVKGSETGTSFKQALYFMDCGFNLHDTMIYKKDSTPYPDTLRYFASFEYMFIFSKGKPKTVHLIADKPNKYAGSKILATSRQRDGTLEKCTCRKNNIERCVKPFGVRQNVWEYSVGKNKTTKDAYAYKHPAMFPEKLAQDHIVSWSDPDDLVFDPFMGSATTGKMAVINRRKFLGIELDKQYFEIAQKRINDNLQLVVAYDA